MLRWSGRALEIEVDLDAIGTGVGHGGLAHGGELIAFADAIAGYDDDRLAVAQARLADAAGVVFVVDAAAVAANFEMMTRVADGTGARFAPDVRSARESLGERLGVHPQTHDGDNPAATPSPAPTPTAR